MVDALCVFCRCFVCLGTRTGHCVDRCAHLDGYSVHPKCAAMQFAPTAALPSWIGGDIFDSRPQVTNVAFSAVVAQNLCAVIPNFLKVGLCSRRAHVASHGSRASFDRLRAMKPSKSNGIEIPLCSPSIRAERS